MCGDRFGLRKFFKISKKSSDSLAQFDSIVSTAAPLKFFTRNLKTKTSTDTEDERELSSLHVD